MTPGSRQCSQGRAHNLPGNQYNIYFHHLTYQGAKNLINTVFPAVISSQLSGVSSRVAETPLATRPSIKKLKVVFIMVCFRRFYLFYVVLWCGVVLWVKNRGWPLMLRSCLDLFCAARVMHRSQKLKNGRNDRNDLQCSCMQTQRRLVVEST
jgi:hypothetical protein